MILVVGMARSGIAAAKLLHGRGLPVFVTDAADSPLKLELDRLGIPYETGGHTLDRFLQAGEIVVSPGVPLTIPPLAAARRKHTPIVGEIELAQRYLKGDIVAITGSNGKTTTTSLIGEILKATGRPVQVGGNIGTPLSSLVESSSEDAINVVEVSSFQLDGIRDFRPDVAALLNITPDHMDRYASFEDYRAAKFRLTENMRPQDTAVLNGDDVQVFPPPAGMRCRQLLFSRKRPVPAGAWLEGDRLVLNGVPVMDAVDVPLRGAHNIDNVLAALAVASRYAIPAAALAAAIRRFPGVEHRIEAAGAIDGVEFFNDSKATNVDSAVKAVESFESGIVLILGGKDKGASYAPLVEAMRGRVRHVVLLGAAAGVIAEAIGDAFPVTHAASMQEAVQAGRRVARRGDVVLLSPACASFDMFDDYEHRGRVFKEAVRVLADANSQTQNHSSKARLWHEN